MFKTTITRYPAFTDVDGDKSIPDIVVFDCSTIDNKDDNQFDGLAKIKFDNKPIGLFTNALINAFKSASTMAIYADEKH